MLEAFAANVGRDPPRASSRSGPRATLSDKADAASTHPWVRDHMVRKLGGGIPAHPLKRPRIPEALHTEELDEVSLREVHAEVEETRLEWLREHGADEVALEHLKMELRGVRGRPTTSVSPSIVAAALLLPPLARI